VSDWMLRCGGTDSLHDLFPNQAYFIYAAGQNLTLGQIDMRATDLVGEGREVVVYPHEG